MSGDTVIKNELQAFNLSAASENKIHDDAVAQKFGFQGGLVPGVEVYAYMMNPAIRHFGPDWLESGNADCRLMKPVYDGRQAQITGEPAGNDGLAIKVESEGILCATGTASMGTSTPAPSPNSFAVAALPDFDARPDAAPETLPDGMVLGTFEQVQDPAEQAQYLLDVRDSLDIYAKEKIVHPGWILRLANRALSHNVKLGPWMHVGSKVRNLGVPRYGDTLAARARVTRNYEHKGHLFVDIDVLVTRSDGVGLVHIDHTSIYRPRQVSQAA
ncbi:MAG: hotdog fold domain-containing protein [Alphaproteobacteria bacterium]|nr:hotdog fold domain-containing protein [Alphaproteobacteria bacterium]